MAEEYIEELLYRGRPPGHPELPAWHIVLAEIARPQNQRVLSVSEAISEEIELPKIIEDLNMGGAAIIETLRADNEKLAQNQYDGQKMNEELQRRGELLLAAERHALRQEDQLARQGAELENLRPRVATAEAEVVRLTAALAASDAANARMATEVTRLQALVPKQDGEPQT